MSAVDSFDKWLHYLLSRRSLIFIDDASDSQKLLQKQSIDSRMNEVLVCRCVD
jgi:hypothetical protein